MLPTASGSFRLFSAFQITVYLHWSWFILALLQVHFASQSQLFDNSAWHILVFIGLFGLVTLHEFGHALACRSVGGQANQIVLWPLGGAAYVRPPARPGPTLWSIVAGPLVNAVLFPVFAVAVAVTGSWGELNQMSDPQRFIFVLALINTMLLLFNMLPIFPLDGGQILQSILWFFMGRGRSLQIVAGMSIVSAGAIGIFALSRGDTWLLILTVFIAWNAINGFRAARYLIAAERMGIDPYQSSQ